MSGTISLVLSLTIIASLGALTRPAERDLRRTSPTDWLPDVAERLRVLESHAADAERRRIQLEPPTSLGGPHPPLPPAAGRGEPR